jgi:hypothetical protein
MAAKIKIDLESRCVAGHEYYTVKRIVNTLAHKPGEALSEQEVQDLIRRVAVRGGNVTITEGKD